MSQAHFRVRNVKRNPFVGVWLSHREALLFWANEDGDMDTQHLKSEYQETAEPVERATQCAPGVIGPVFPHASVERRRKEQLKHYYKQLAKMLQGAKHLYLFGSGLAKHEFARFLREDKEFASRIAGVENAGHMTQAQKVVRVRQFFRLPGEIE